MEIARRSKHMRLATQTMNNDAGNMKADRKSKALCQFISYAELVLSHPFSLPILFSGIPIVCCPALKEPLPMVVLLTRLILGSMQISGEKKELSIGKPEPP